MSFVVGVHSFAWRGRVRCGRRVFERLERHRIGPPTWSGTDFSSSLRRPRPSGYREAAFECGALRYCSHVCGMPSRCDMHLAMGRSIGANGWWKCGYDLLPPARRAETSGSLFHASSRN